MKRRQQHVTSSSPNKPIHQKDKVFLSPFDNNVGSGNSRAQMTKRQMPAGAGPLRGSRAPGAYQGRVARY